MACRLGQGLAKVVVVGSVAIKMGEKIRFGHSKPPPYADNSTNGAQYGRLMIG